MLVPGAKSFGADKNA
ncbi:hypothetical protein D020_0163A, partial [Vibrio parahaemolyticus SBR10290]